MQKPFKFPLLVALLFVVIGSSACFDIEETYHFRKDGSGTAQVTVDMSQLLSLMESFSESLDSTGGDTDESIDEIFSKNEAVANLSRIPGISKVKDLNDKENGIIGYSYEFSDIGALNNALVATEGTMDMDQLMGGESSGAGETSAENRFERKGKTLKRIYTMEPEDEEEGTGDEEEEQYKQMAEMMFANNSYTIIYNFDQDVKKVKKNDKAEVRGRTVTIETPMLDLINGEAELGAQIKLK